MGDRASNSPEVLVLGMPSSGKTVFLSVLGRNFTLVADDSDARPLGFRMRAIGRSTQEAVSRNYARILGGEWPASTVAGSVTPLTWDVFTGARKVFTLSSMDVSGESFVKAFCEDGSEAIHQREKDGLLDMAQSESRSGDVVELLRELALSAKVICFFINIAAARKGRIQDLGGSAARHTEVDAVRNYEEGIANICALLDELPSLRSKAIVVLTQAHRHQSEIEKSGGPAAFLGRIAPNLRQTVAEFDIPVIAVSAINERDSANGFDEEDEENLVPERIESDGLFGFLLVVAGMIPDARLAVVKDCYLRYLADKTRYLQLMCRTILERLPLIKAYASSGTTFEKACLDYLGDAVNVNSEGQESLSRSVVDLYRRCTVSDKDVSSAASAWKRRLAIDMAWDHVFRRIVIGEAKMVANGANSGNVSKTPSAQEIVDAVRGELERGSAVGGNLTQAALYGFERDELDPVRDAADEGAWVLKCLDEYRLRIASDLDDCMQHLLKTRQMIAAIDPMRGEGFNIKKESVVEAISKYRELLSAFESDWFVNEVGGLPQIEALGREVATMSESLSKLVQRHYKWLDEVETERQQKAMAKAQARQLAYESEIARERRLLIIRILMLAIGIGIVVAMLFGLFLNGRSSRVRQNKSYWDAATNAYENGNYEYAKNNLDRVRGNQFFFISRSSFVDETVESKIAEKLEEIRQREEMERQGKIDAEKKACNVARSKAVEMGAEEGDLQGADGEMKSADLEYFGKTIGFDDYIARLRKSCGDYNEIAEKAHARQVVVAARRKCYRVREEIEEDMKKNLLVPDFGEADKKRGESTRSFSCSEISIDDYTNELAKVEGLYRDARKNAEKVRIAKVKEECDNARTEAEKSGADDFASSDMVELRSKQSGAEKSYSEGAISFGEYLKKLEEIVQSYNSAKEKAEKEQKVKVGQATNECNNAHEDAKKIGADVLTSSFKNASQIRDEAEEAYSNGAIDSMQYVEKINSATRLYNEAKKSALRNRRSVLVCAKLKNKEVNIPIIEGLDRVRTTPVTVGLNKKGIGETCTFLAEGVIDGIMYKGEASHVVQRGTNQTVTIYLGPKYTLDLNYCPFCDTILGIDRKHVITCPGCDKDLSPWLKW